MARNSFAQIFTPHTQQGEQIAAPSGLASRLIEYACTEPNVDSFEVGGPEWAYVKEEKQRTTRPYLTLHRRDGGTAYWSVLSLDKPDEPMWVDIQRQHALHADAEFWLLTHRHLQEHPIERENRKDAYHLLVHAKSWSSAHLEPTLLTETAGEGKTVEQLRDITGAHLHHIYVAGLRLWMQGLVDLPIASERLAPTWTLRGKHHG